MVEAGFRVRWVRRVLIIVVRGVHGSLMAYLPHLHRGDVMRLGRAPAEELLEPSRGSVRSAQQAGFRVRWVRRVLIIVVRGVHGSLMAYLPHLHRGDVMRLGRAPAEELLEPSRGSVRSAQQRLSTHYLVEARGGAPGVRGSSRGRDAIASGLWVRAHLCRGSIVVGAKAFLTGSEGAGLTMSRLSGRKKPS